MRAQGRRAVAALLAVVSLLSGLAVATPAAAQTVLRVTMHSDLKIIDPIWTTALISADHGYLVYDTLFSLDESLTIRPQMVDKWEVSPDKLTWTFTLRDGLAWHDGTPVTGADCVASIRRWGARDSMGQMLMSFTSELSAPDERTIRLVLREPYGLVLAALGKTGDWQTLVTRRTKKDPPDKGGWHVFFTTSGALSIPDPVAHFFINASCDKAQFGWPCDAEIERLRDQYARAGDVESQRAIAVAVQRRVAEYPTHLPLGQFTSPTARRTNITGVLTAPALVFWNIEKK